MGAKVRGAGTETLTITGVKELSGTSHSVVQDRIEAGTFMVAAAMTGGNVLVQDAIWEHNRPLIAKLMEWVCLLPKRTKEFGFVRIYPS